MAEPVGVTGTAVGIVSLCLQICNSLNEYLSDFRDRDAYVNKALEHLGRLRDLIGVIEPAVLAIQNEHDTPSQRVLQCLRSCEVEIVSLDTEIQKHVPAAATSPWQKLREMRKKLEFPFARSDLEKLAGQLDRINKSLSLALQGLDLHVQVTNRDKLVDIVNSNRTTSGELAAIRGDINDINSRGANLEASLTVGRVAVANITRDMQRLSLVDTKFQASSQKIDQIQAATSSSNELLRDLAAHQRSVARLEGLMNEVKDLITQAGRDSPAQMLLQMLVSRPSLLKSFQDDLETIHLNISRPPNESEQESSPVRWQKRRKPKTRSCGCRPRRQTARAYSRWLFLTRFSESIIHIDHEPWCHLYSPNQMNQQHSSGAIFSGLRGLLNVALLVSFTSRRGAGGYSFSPTFRYYAMVDEEKSPAFLILREITDGLWYISNAARPGSDFTQYRYRNLILQAGISKLRRIYCNGLSSPTDINKSGSTVLDCFLYAQFGYFRETKEHQLLSCYETALWLLDIGVPFLVNSPKPLDNELHSHTTLTILTSSYLAEELVPSTKRRDIIPLLIKSYPENFSYAVDHSLLWIMKNTLHQECLLEVEGVAELFGLDHPLLLALMKQDEDLLGHILSEPSSPLDSCAQNRLLIAAKVAISWPKGLEILLNHRPDIDLGTTGNKPSVIGVAFQASYELCRERSCTLYQDCPRADSVEILLKSPCHPANTTCCLNNPENCRSLIAQWTENECLPCSRHNQMFYAEIFGYLTQDWGPGCLKTTETVLKYVRSWQEQWMYILEDYEARNEIRALKAKGIIPFCDFQLHSDGYRVSLPPYHPGGRSIYHLMQEIRLANIAFDLGFTDFDSFCDGITPVMQAYATLDYREWLLEHGADLTCLMDFTPFFKQIPSDILPRLTAAHFIMRFTADSDRLFNSNYSPDVEIRLVRRLGDLQIGDGCTCRCSGQEGCTPLIVFIKQLCRSERYYHKPVLEVITDSISGFVCDNVATSLSTTANQVIRILTFEALEVRHTCCQTACEQYDDYFKTRNWDARETWISYGEDFADIRDEDELLLDEVEELVFEFEDKFHSGGHSLADFLSGYWQERMEEILWEKHARRLTEAEKEAAAELGIELSGEDEKSVAPNGRYKLLRTLEDMARDCIDNMDDIYM